MRRDVRREAAASLPRPELPAEVLDIARRLEEAGHETWAVGGHLRDLLLDLLPEGDFDLATAAPPAEVQRLFRHTVPVGVEHGTVGVLDPSRRLHEVTTFRRDVRTDGRHAAVEFGASLEEDLARRDFTINAIAYHPLRREWKDPFHGIDDLRAGVIRAVGDPERRFREDYLRILRAVRFAARFGFEIEPATWAALVELAPGLAGLSAERVRDEWFKSLRTARSLEHLVQLWHQAGAAPVWLPGLRPEWPAGSVPLDQRDPVILTAIAVLAPAGALERLRCSSAEIARARALEAGPAAPEGDDPAAVRRWLARVGDAADDLLQAARIRAGASPRHAETVRGIRERGEPTRRQDLAIRGNDLVDLGIPPGPELGRLLERLLDVVLADPGQNTRERLLALARQWT